MAAAALALALPGAAWAGAVIQSMTGEVRVGSSEQVLVAARTDQRLAAGTTIVTGPGALVVVDSARLDDCYPAIDFFERARLPFVVAVNAFDGRLAHDLGAIRWALAIGDHVPLVQFDARDRLSVRDALLIVLDRALERAIRERDS